MYRTMKYFTTLCLCILILCSCGSKKENVNQGQSNEDAQEITIYMPVNIIYGNTEDIPDLYVSKYRIGECWNYKMDNTIYGAAIAEYEKKSGIAVHVQYFDSQLSMEEKLKEDINTGSMPDVVVCDASATKMVYTLTNNEHSVDLEPYLEERKEDNQYFEKVEEACKQGKHQYILPLLFNINSVFTTQGDGPVQSYISYEEIITRFENELNQLWLEADVKEAVYAVPTGNPVTVSYILWNSIGASGYSFENKQYNLDEVKIKQLFEFTKRYMEFEHDFEHVSDQTIPDRSCYVSEVYLRPFLMASSSGEAESLYLDYLDQISYWIDGSSGCNWPPSSLALQSQFYSSQLQKSGDKLLLLPISKETDEESYNASITYFGFVTNNTRNQDAAADLLLYLQDCAVDSRFGFSVNQTVTEKGLRDLTETTWELHNFDMNAQVLGYIEPLPSELKEQISSVLEKIESATLPNGTIELECLYNALEQYMGGEKWETCFQTLQVEMRQNNP